MSDPGAQPPRKLSLFRVLTGAFVLPWRHRDDVIRQAGLPILLVAAVSIVWGLFFTDLPVGRWVFWLVYVLFTCWLAVTVHRMVLLDHPGSPLVFDGEAIRRLATFFAISLGFWVFYSGVRMVLFSGAVAILGSRYVPAGEHPGEFPVSLVTLDLVVSALAFVAIGRLALLLPSIAAGDRFDLVAVWRRSARNGWRMAVVVGLLPWLLEALTSMLMRDGASDLEWSVLQLIVAITLMFEVVALSLAYRELMAPSPPPTDPPA